MRRDSPLVFGIEKKQAIRPVLLRRSEAAEYADYGIRSDFRPFMEAVDDRL